MFTIGCHLSSAKGYLHMAKDAVSIDANTFQFFTRNPRGGRAKAIDPKDVAAYAAYAPEHGIERILAHAPYTLNPASDKQQTRDFALMVLAEDLGRMEETPHQLYNMHPGSAVGQPCEVAIAKIADASLGTEVDEALLGDAERDLLSATEAARELVADARGRRDFDALIAGLAALREPIDRFFDDVLVMDEDEALRANRLRLLNRFEAVFADIANIGLLKG